MALAWMPAKAYGGPLKPTVVVVHCTESDNGAGTAESLAGPNWFGGPAGTSAHKMFDQNSGVEMVKRTVVAYHAGPKGNTVGVSYEFCGRASWSAAKWREPAQLTMLRLAAPHIADDLRAMDAPARWLSLAQLAAKAKGLCTHNDIRLALGGTTHSDPGPNFPYAELLAYVQAELNGTPATIAPEDDMFSDQDRNDLRDLKVIVASVLDSRPDGPLSNSNGELMKRVRDIHGLVAALAGRDSNVTIDAATIAAAIPANLAKQVADELSKRLAA